MASSYNPICVSCNTVINGLAVGEDDVYFHAECFCCYVCQTPIDQNIGFVHKNDHIYHPSCYEETEAPRCDGCGEVLKGKFVKALNQQWHKTCFVCNGCGSTLENGYALQDNVPYCANCINKPKPTQIVTSQPHKGIRVDPRSGKVSDVSNKHKFCPECGTKVQASKFCTECGVSILKQ